MGDTATVLHISTRFRRGGAEARIGDMIRALPEFDHHVILGPDSDLEFAGQRLPTVTIDVEPFLIRNVRPVQDLVCLWRLRRAIREVRPVAVVTHQSKAGALGRMAAWTASTPAVHSLSMASFGPGYSRAENVVFKVVEKVLAPATAAYAVVGEDLMRRFSGLGLPSAKFHVVRSGLRLVREGGSRRSWREQAAAEWDIDPEIPWLIVVGSLEARKNVHLAPSLVRELQNQDWNVQLLMVGSGPLRDRVEQEAADLGVAEEITLTGYRHDALELIYAADVLVLMSSSEGLPQVLVQAAAVDTPFVTFDVDGAREVLSLGGRGVIVDTFDIPAMASAISTILEHDKRTSGSLDTSSWGSEEITSGYRLIFGSRLGLLGPSDGPGP